MRIILLIKTLSIIYRLVKIVQQKAFSVVFYKGKKSNFLPFPKITEKILAFLSKIIFVEEISVKK